MVVLGVVLNLGVEVAGAAVVVVVVVVVVVGIVVVVVGSLLDTGGPKILKSLK